MSRSPGALKLRQVPFKLMVPFAGRFSLIKHHLVEFNQLAMANSEGSDHMLNRVMPKDNIGLAALLKTKEPAWETGQSFMLYVTCLLILDSGKKVLIPTKGCYSARI